jgi:hypothetical protein
LLSGLVRPLDGELLLVEWQSGPVGVISGPITGRLLRYATSASGSIPLFLGVIIRYGIFFAAIKL